MNYRDDFTDRMLSGDRASGTLHAVLTATCGAKDTTRSKLAAMISDGIQVADPAEARQIAVSVSDIEVADVARSVLCAAGTFTETAQASDGASAILRQLAEEAGVLSDATLAAFITQEESRIRADSAAQSRLKATVDMVSAARIRSDYTPIFRYLADELMEVTDRHDAQQGALLLLVAAIMAKDDYVQRLASRALLCERVSIRDTPSLHVSARLAITEEAYVDASLSAGAQAMAWTANVSTWASSRYLPYNYNSIAVIDGRLYGTAADGVYLLDDEESVETIHAMIRTGQIEVSDDVLARLESVYCVYEARADVMLAVEQTQQGDIPERYEYALPDKTADVMTTGRFVLGKGLRGRTFTFELNAEGERGNFLELDVGVVRQSRRV